MKKIAWIAACLLPAAVMVQGQSKITLSGKVGNLGPPAKAYLYYGLKNKQVIKDSVAIVNGKFAFTGPFTGICNATILINHDGAPAKDVVSPDALVFYLEPAAMQIVSATDSVKYASVQSSKVNDDHAKYQALTKSSRDKNAALIKEYYSKSPEQRKDEIYIETVRSRGQANRNEMIVLNKQFYAVNLDSYIGLEAYQEIMNIDQDLKGTEAEFDKFSATVKGTALGKSISEQIEAAKKTGIGQMAMDFSQNNVEDKPVKLSDFRGKYVLLDFWASWCGPCRAENPNVVKAFHAFKDKNFTVLGVSLDNPGNKAAWLTAIEKDGLAWTQVSDLKGWGNAASKLYGIRSIPANFLIDPSGKIIAKNVRGEELYQKLEVALGKSK